MNSTTVVAIVIAAATAVGISLVMTLNYDLLQKTLSAPVATTTAFNHMSEEEIIAQYMRLEAMTGCSVSLADASENTPLCRGPDSLVAVHIPDNNRELTIREGSSATVDVMLLHAANAEGFPELTVVLGSNKSMSSNIMLKNGTEYFFTDHMYYGDRETTTNTATVTSLSPSAKVEKERVVVLKANETKTVPVTIDIPPQSFPDEVTNTMFGFEILFDVQERSQVNRSSFGGIGARGDHIFVTVVK